MEDGTWQQAADCTPCTPLVDRGTYALLLLDGSNRRISFDAVFPVLHGRNGEDGTVQGPVSYTHLPDITLLEPLARIFRVSIAELFSGNAVTNGNVSANMLRSRFYVCPVCGNCIHTMGEAVSRTP